jgi:hypothetical protein
LSFDRVDRREAQRSVTADEEGRFHLTLSPGEWQVSLNASDGKLLLQVKVTVQEERHLLLVQPMR